MAKITITIDGDNVTINQSAAPTKVEKENKKFFIIMRTDNYYGTSWVEFVTDDYIMAANKFRCVSCDDDYIYKLYMQDEKGNILPCNGTDWDIDRQSVSLLITN